MASEASLLPRMASILVAVPYRGAIFFFL